MKKNERYIVKIVDIGMDGEGIAKVDGQVVFVPFAYLDEEVEILIINTKSKFVIGKVVNVIKPSPNRVNALCPYYTKCGGCDLQHINYDTELQVKYNSLKNTLKKVANIDFDISKVVRCDREYFYRNKVALPVVYENGNTIVGMYRKNSHKIVKIDECVIEEKFVTTLIKIMNTYITNNKVLGYDEQNHTGILRHIVARCYDDEILVTLVVIQNSLPNIDNLTNLLSKNFKSFGLDININNKNTNVIMGDKTIHIKGIEALTIKEKGIQYEVSNLSFLQVNNYIKNKIYDFVLSNINNTDIIVDMYSGLGILTSMLSQKAKYVYGIEIVESAINNANDLMLKNNITNVTNICGDVEVELQKLSKHITNNFSVVVDPPRKGLGDNVVNLLLNYSPLKIIYISCNPATLARDLKTLTNKYKILSITPFDMFPKTKHIETVVVLEKM